MTPVTQSLIIFGIAFLMTMTGRGGGNFYVLALVLSGLSMHQSASAGQLILFVSSVSATIIFGRGRQVEWKLVLLIGSLTALSAFFGGLYAHLIPGKILKYIFSFFLLAASFLMLRPVKPKTTSAASGRGILTIQSGEHEFSIRLLTAVPIIVTTGFGAGMVGVSGGSFLVPLMVLACGVPMNLAVGTSTTMVAATALTGFTGHLISGDAVPLTALILAAAGACGGLLGGSLALRTKPKKLKILFAWTTLAAAAVMMFNAAMSG